MARQRFTPAIRSAVLAATNGRCSYCGNEIDPHSDYAIDHINPVARGGKNALPNLTASCRTCNGLKRDRTLLHFLIVTAPIREEPSPMTDAGKRTIRELREAKGLSRAALGKLLNVSGQAIYYWEHGRSYPSAPLLYRLADALGVKMDEIELIERNPKKRTSMRS